MKNQIINTINALKSSEIYANKRTSKSKSSWVFSVTKNDYVVELATTSYDTNQLQLTLTANYEEYKVLVLREEIKPFLNMVRRTVEGSYYKNQISEVKRIELLTIFKNATNNSKSKFFKEPLTKIEGNEEKKYYFRMLGREVDNSQLEDIDFFQFSISELIKDKRLKDSNYTSEDYQVLLSSEEVCEIFQIDLKKFIIKKFNDKFWKIINNKSVENELPLDSGEKVSDQLNQELMLNNNNISQKIRKIL